MRKFRSLLIIVAILSMTLLMEVILIIAENAPEGWIADYNIVNDTSNSIRPDIAVDSQNNVHIVWADGKDEGGIFYKNYDGEVWSEVHLDSYNPEARDNGNNGGFPSITVDNEDNVHVAFAAQRKVDFQFEIFYTTNDGTSWSTPLRLTVNSGYSVAWAPQLGPKIVANSQNHLYIFWSGFKNYNGNNDLDIFYVEHDGNIWSEIQDVTNDLRPGYDHFNPVVSIDSNDKIHIAYVTTESNYMIHYRQSDGNEWSEETRISDGEFAVNYPSIAIDSQNNVHLIWGDNRHSETVIAGETYYSKLDNEGNTLIDDLRITNGYPDSSELNNIAVDLNDNLNIIWERTEDENSDNKTIWYTKLTNDGITVIEDLQLSLSHTPDIFVLDTVHIATDSQNRLHVVFQDDREGNLEIYYKTTYEYDLSLSDNDIQFSNPLPINGESILINATIHNNGEAPTDATVYFYLDNIHSNNLIASEQISVMAEETFLTSITWDAITGNHNIWIEIECETGITESNITNNIAFKEIIVNDPPTITVINPPTGIVTVDTSYSISWLANDPDDDANIQLYYDSDNVGHDGILIPTSDQYPSGIVDDNGASQTYEWDTSGLEDGSSFYIYAKIDDGLHDPIYVYSPGKIKIDHQNIAPTIDISSPSSGTHSGIVTIQGTASDDISVAVVEIKIDNNQWDEAEGTTSWSYEWYTSSYTNGEHTITARAKDNSGLYSLEDSKTVTVNNGGNLVPSVEIKSHSMDAVVSGTIEIEGISQDNDGNVELVEIKVDNGNWQTTSGTSSWSYFWDTTTYPNGEHEIHIRAMDNSQEYSQIESITLIVSNGGNVPPIVTIISPSGGTVSGSVTIRGSASDLDGDNKLSFVEIKIEDNWESVNGITEWSYEWDTSDLDDGTYTISARAYDGIEYSLEKSVEVAVDNPHEPTLIITSEIPDEVTGTLEIHGTASDIDGEIIRIEILIDDGEWEEISGTTNWNYDLDTTKLSDGEHTIRVRVHDDEGEYYEEVFSINVNNSSDIIWLIIIVVIILIVAIFIAVGLMRKKPQKPVSEPLAPQPTTQNATQSIRCPQCNNVFEVPGTATAVQCPFCGTNGTLK